MLVLTRKLSQVIKLGEDITITVVRTSHGSVTLGIDAPPDIRVMRADRINADFPQRCESTVRQS